jgi:hypothetical protein
MKQIQLNSRCIAAAGGGVGIIRHIYCVLRTKDGMRGAIM